MNTKHQSSQEQQINCCMCHKQVQISNGTNTAKGFICNNCAKNNKKSKLIITSTLVIILLIAISIYLYNSYFGNKVPMGFSGVEQINDSTKVYIEEANVDMILSDKTAYSPAISTQNPISNLEEYKHAFNNIIDATQNNSEKIMIPSICVMFTINTNYIVNNGEELVKEFAKSYLQTDKKASIIVEGYTCDLGGKKLNMTLSKQRAYAVKDILISAGVPIEMIDIKWYGKSRYKDFHYPNKKDYRRVNVYIK